MASIRRTLAVGAAVVGYAVAFPFALPYLHEAAGLLSAVPLAAAWLLLSTRATVIAAMVLIPLDLILYDALDGELPLAAHLLAAVLFLAGAGWLGLRALHDVRRRSAEQEALLRESELRLRSVVSSAPIILYALDREGRYVFQDGSGLAALGIVPGEHIGRSFFEVNATDPHLCALTRRALSGEEIRTTYGGDEISFDIHYVPVRDRGIIAGVIGVAIDVSASMAAQRELERSTDRFQRLFQLAPVVSSISRVSDNRLMDVNDAFCETFKLARWEAIGRTAEELGIWPDPVDRAALLEQLATNGGSVRGRETRAQASDGSERLILGSWDRATLDGEDVVIASGVDITAGRRTEVALQESETRFSRAFERNPAAIAITRLADGQFLEANESWIAVTGYGADELIGHTADELGLWVDGGAAAIEDVVEHGSIRDKEQRLRAKSGEIREMLASLEVLDFAAERVVLTTAIDITDRKHAERKLEFRALHDDLTGLPNRVLLADRLDHAITAARRERTSVALLVMDLDHFKEINDTFGHHAGDALLQQIGPRLRDEVRASDTVTRLGGDEFALVLPGASAAGAKQIARGVTEAVGRPFVIDDQPLHVDGSLGIAMFPDHGNDAETLLRRADIAMYIAKRTGTGVAEYDASKDTSDAARLALLGELGAAIENDELVLYYQPQVRISDGQVIAMEGLVRWQHPTRGLLLPEAFLPQAERTALIRPLTRHVLRIGLEQLAAWLPANPDLRMAINLSARDLADPALVELVIEAAGAAGVPPSAIVLEITENLLMADAIRIGDTINRLRQAGIGLSVDDFGTGYSSLGLLSQLAVHQVKIDRSFVGTMRTDPGHAAIVRATIDLGHGFGAEVVAEGVEDALTLAALADLGCDIAQGDLTGAAAAPSTYRRGRFPRRAVTQTARARAS